MTDRHIWESIDTAPKDGTLMFLDYGDGVLRIGRWTEAQEDWFCEAKCTEDGHVYPVDRFLAPNLEPRRWQELPSAPLPYREEDEAA